MDYNTNGRVCRETINHEQRKRMELFACHLRRKIDISKYGIEHNRCIDGDLITRIAWKDQELMNFMKVKIEDTTPSLFGEADIPQGAFLLSNNKYFMSAHKKILGNENFVDAWQQKTSANTILVPIFANTAMRIHLKK